MTFAALQGLRNQKMNFMTFQDPWEPWFAVYRQSSKHSYNETKRSWCVHAGITGWTNTVCGDASYRAITPAVSRSAARGEDGKFSWSERTHTWSQDKWTWLFQLPAARFLTCTAAMTCFLLSSAYTSHLAYRTARGLRYMLDHRWRDRPTAKTSHGGHDDLAHGRCAEFKPGFQLHIT